MLMIPPWIDRGDQDQWPKIPQIILLVETISKRLR